MSKKSEHVNRRWPWNSHDEDDDRIEPYDELEDVKRKDDEFNDW